MLIDAGSRQMPRQIKKGPWRISDLPDKGLYPMFFLQIREPAQGLAWACNRLEAHMHWWNGVGPLGIHTLCKGRSLTSSAHVWCSLVFSQWGGSLLAGPPFYFCRELSFCLINPASSPFNVSTCLSFSGHETTWLLGELRNKKSCISIME